MGIGVLIGLAAGKDVAAAFRRAREIGFDCCQVSCWNTALYTRETAARVREAAEETGVAVTALWAGWSGPAEWNFTYGPATLGLVPAAYRGMRLRELLCASEFAEWLGVTDVITHVGFLPEDPNDPDFVGTVGALRTLCRAMGKKGQYFLFETGQETPVTMLRAIEAIGMENVGINFDTANLLLYGKANPVDALDVFGRYVRNTHCKDGEYPTTGTKLGREVPLGEGRADLPRIVEKLRALGYTGPFIIEREIEGERQMADLVAGKRLLESILTKKG